MMVISQIIDYFNVLNFPKVQILKTKQYVQLMPFTMYFQKHSCFLKSFNDQINLFASSGLITAWRRNYEKSGYKSEPMLPKGLSIDQIAGVITVCICLIAASILVFIFELISTCHEAMELVMDFLTSNAHHRRKFTKFPRKGHSNVINHH